MPLIHPEWHNNDGAAAAATGLARRQRRLRSGVDGPEDDDEGDAGEGHRLLYIIPRWLVSSSQTCMH